MSSIIICQVTSCNNFRYTLCPHCSMEVCMNCLNEHYFSWKNDYKKVLLDFKKELNTRNHYKIEKQKQIFKRLYENEATQYYELDHYLSDKIDKDGIPIVNNVQQHQYVELKENFRLFMENRTKFDQLLNQIDHLIFDFQETNRLPVIGKSFKEEKEDIEIVSSNMKPNLDIYFGINDEGNNNSDDDNKSMEEEEEENEEKYDVNESKTESSSIRDVTPFIIDPPSPLFETSHQSNNSSHKHNSSTQKNLSQNHKTKNLRKLHLCCPFTRYTLGLQPHHCQLNGITHIPCDRPSNKSLSLYKHLTCYHSFNYQASIKIIRALLHCSDQIDKINLFSNETLDIANANFILNYTTICPLTRYGIFGIKSNHHVRLCYERNLNNCNLHSHLREYHHMSYKYATRIVHAVINHVNPNFPIIQLDEDILCLQ